LTDPAVVFGGPSPEHDVSILTGLQASRALRDDGVPVRALYWSKVGDWYEVDPTLEGKDFVDGAPGGARPLRLVAGKGGGYVAAGRGLVARERALALSAAVNCCHGGPGEDGTLQGALDLAGVPYTGPTVAGAALGMDKLAFGGVVVAAGLPSLPRVALTTDGEVPFGGPYIVKPRFGGSSIGVDIVEDVATARARLAANTHLRAGAVIEPYRPESIDLEIAIRSWPSLELSAVDRPLRSSSQSDILGYADKYVGGEGMVSAPRELPARLAPGVDKQVRDVAVAVAGLAGGRGVARLDFLLEGDQLYVNEINTIPGSLAWHLWIDPELPFSRLLRDLLAEATERPSTHYTTAGADGSALRAAGSIGGKLA
jgi:D-alanine-D-alanine ligase